MKAFLPFSWDRLPDALASMRKSFYCGEIFEVRALNPSRPSRPDFLLFTSQNAVRAYVDLAWDFAGLQALCVGRKTFECAQQAGLNAIFLGPPPALDCVPSLPDGQGLWLSGEHVAHDLPLARLPIYALRVHDKAEAEALRALQSHKIKNIFVTSEQIAAWAGESGLGFEGAAVLSPRLAEAAKRHMPALRQVWTVPDFESGVRVLYAPPSGGEIDE